MTDKLKPEAEWSMNEVHLARKAVYEAAANLDAALQRAAEKVLA